MMSILYVGNHRQLKEVQNKTNSEKSHFVFLIFKKTTRSVIFRFYSKDNVKPVDYITNKLCYI